ncbi:MAG: HAMP domain-containing histidine kinase [Sedimentisphaerales bacterium]|nr:HAMP domain-containing histidine kinase [Sedimentisphaerales bacterium]
MKNRPLKWCLSLLICVVLMSTIITLSIVAYVELEEALLRNIDPVLRTMAEEILAKLDEPGSLEPNQSEFPSITGWYTGGRYSNQYRIWMDGSKEKLLASDISDKRYGRLFTDLPEDNRPEISKFTFFNLNRKDYQYRAVWTRIPFRQGIANILVAGSSRYAYHEMEEFLQLLIILGGSLLLGALLLVPLIVAWGMNPIDRVAESIRHITYKNLGQDSLQDMDIPQELLPIVESLSDMLARLDQAIQQQKQFTADASHELRTPLAILKSTIQTTSMTARDVTDYTRALEDTLQDVNRMEQLVEQLLCLARIDEDRGSVKTTRIALDDLLTPLMESFNARAASQGGKVTYNPIPTCIQGNENELTQLFTNILDNAIKYGPLDGTIHVTIENEDNYVTVCVHDEGGAIPPEVLPHLFDRFYRAESSRSRSTGGAGLGLAIAREIVHRHRGKIEITSEPQTGTSVYVRLPRL